MYPDERVAHLINENFTPARVHVKDQPEDYRRFEGFLPADDLLAQLTLGLGHSAFARQQWDEAERWFREVVNRFPNSEAAPEALYWAGVSRYKSKGDASALGETAGAFSRKYQDSSWAKKASVWNS